MSTNKEKRISKFRALCHQYQMTYSATDEFGMKVMLKYFDIYKRNGIISNLCQQKSTDLISFRYLFDYKFVVSRGNHSKRYVQTVFFVHDREMFLPVFLMKPENVAHKIAAFFGWEDIDFETNPHFSNLYHLTGEDENWIRDNFQDTVLSFFSKTSGWHVEAANHYLLFYALDSLIPENILFDFYKMGMHVHQLFKDSQKELLPLTEAGA